MLQTEYVNNFNHNYLKLKIKKQNNEKLRYQYQIITTRRLEGLLPVSMHSDNGEPGLYYEISSMQSMSKWFIKEKINYVWLENLVLGLQVVLWSLEQYLLDNRNLILQPNFIFQDMESEKIYFLYQPYYIEEEKQDIESFLSFLVENVDEKEPDTVEIVYGIFSVWENMPEQFFIETFLGLWEKYKKERAADNPCEKIDTENSCILPKEQKEPDGITGRGKDIAEFLFGRYRHPKEEVPKACLTMESWEYNAVDETQEAKESEGIGKTAYAEVSAEAEERKLYGNGKQNRKVISLEKLPVVIGKKEGIADVVLKDASVSRMHARFTEEKEQVYLEDLNATNGTYKNGVRLKPYERVEIWKEDEITLGKLKFTYR